MKMGNTAVAPDERANERNCFEAARSFCSGPKSRPSLAGRTLCASALAVRVLLDDEAAVITAGL